MLRGQDILVLLKLANASEASTVRALAAELGLEPTSVHRALARLREARLIDGRRPRPNRAAIEEFLLHGFRYSFPPRQGGPTRGVPTAWGAAPLKEMLARSDDPPPVWPDPKGKARGPSLEPVHADAPAVARRDPALGEQLALLDAIRLEDPRLRELAGKRLRESLRTRAPSA